MASIAEGGKVTKAMYDGLVAFAKEKRVKKPSEDAVSKSATCAKDGCDKPAKAKGYCITDYTREVYRKDPEKLERTREAGRKSAAKRRAAAKAAKAAKAS